MSKGTMVNSWSEQLNLLRIFCLNFLGWTLQGWGFRDIVLEDGKQIFLLHIASYSPQPVKVPEFLTKLARTMNWRQTEGVVRNFTRLISKAAHMGSVSRLGLAPNSILKTRPY